MQGNTIRQTGSVSSRRWKIYTRRRDGFKETSAAASAGRDDGGRDDEINGRTPHTLRIPIAPFGSFAAPMTSVILEKIPQRFCPTKLRRPGIDLDSARDTIGIRDVI